MKYKIRLEKGVWYAYEHDRIVAKSKSLNDLEQKLDWIDNQSNSYFKKQGV